MHQTDRDAVINLCAHIWDGHDYIPQVFDDWLSSVKGQFTAITNNDGALIGFGKLTSITDRDWWIEGIRVHPAHRGQRVSRRLFEYLITQWSHLSPPDSSLRLLTDHDNHTIQHLCQSTGFRYLGNVTPYRADSCDTPHPFKKLSPLEARSFFSLAERSYYYHSHHHLYQAQTLWRWAEITPDTLTQRDVWLWRDGRGMVMIEDVEDADNPVGAPCIYIDFIGVAREDLTDCLNDARALAASLDRSTVGIGLSLSDTILVEALAQSGYTRALNEGILYLYEQRK